jgi:hypothetical protein
VPNPIKGAKSENLLVVDEDGKEHEMEIAKETLRQPDQSGK